MYYENGQLTAQINSGKQISEFGQLFNIKHEYNTSLYLQLL